jgi:hypothetical protein
MKSDIRLWKLFVSFFLFLVTLASCHQKGVDKMISSSYLIYDTLYGGDYFEMYPKVKKDNPRISLYSDLERTLKVKNLSKDTSYRIYFSLHKYDGSPLEWIKVNSKESPSQELKNYYFDVRTNVIEDSIKVSVCFKQNNITIIGICNSPDCSHLTFDTAKMHYIIVEEYIVLY